MDHKTHITMTYKLLKTCDCDEAASIYSLVPVIDREPAHFHRLYGHVLANVPKIADAAIMVLSNPEMSSKRDEEAPPYEFRRCREEKEYFKKLLNDVSCTIDDEKIRTPSFDKTSVFIAILSHIYFDTFNNPVQAFLPESSYCSGQWDFWTEVDYFKFRGDFYSEKIIIPFRERILSDPVWDMKLDSSLFNEEVRERLLQTGELEKKLNPFALIKAMIIRLGELAKPDIEYSVIDQQVRDLLDCAGCVEYCRADREIVFLRELEKKIASLIFESIK